MKKDKIRNIGVKVFFIIGAILGLFTQYISLKITLDTSKTLEWFLNILNMYIINPLMSGIIFVIIWLFIWWLINKLK